jgi:hypothetical protein
MYPLLSKSTYGRIVFAKLLLSEAIGSGNFQTRTVHTSFESKSVLGTTDLYQSKYSDSLSEATVKG